MKRKFRLVEWIAGCYTLFVFSEDGEKIEFARPFEKNDIKKVKDIVNAARDQGGIDLAELEGYETSSSSDKIWEEWCHPYFENLHWRLIADNDRDYVQKDKW